MIQLTPNEARVLGVLIEKATTTPEQYPLSINALTNGANQKNNRDPVLTLSEDEVFDAVEGLRDKQFVVRVDQVGSRVHKYKHTAGETLRCSGSQLAVLAELLLRGPQTLGELRGRASRMHAIESVDDVKNVLRGLIEQEEPLAKELPPAPGSRAERYAQLLAPDSHPLEGSQTVAAVPTTRLGNPSDRVSQLEAEVKALRAAILNLAESIGAQNPFPGETTISSGGS
jgi:uncharacterized protein YceH (UPF0502 family)